MTPSRGVDTIPDCRTESDSFGTVKVPSTRYWGAQTQRASAIFTVSDEQFPTCLIHAFGLQKVAAARANLRLQALDRVLAGAIIAAAEEVSRGVFDDHFPLSIWQTGSGTQTNMNVNEVIANRANEALGQPLGTRSPIHPNDHVNRSQSSNDSFPTVMHITAVLEIRNTLVPSLNLLREELDKKATLFGDVVKIGRTHLMDALPMTVGQGFGAFAHQVQCGLERLDATLPRLHQLAQGGTAVGTGLNAPPGFDVAFCEELSVLTGENFIPNPCKFEGMGSHDALVELSGALNTVAVTLLKIANDVRLLGSGPRCGLGELIVPHDGLTSSIMPSKRNPTLAEVLAQAAFQTVGNHTTVTMAGASGNFELNVAKPVIIYNILQSIRVLAGATRIFALNLVRDVMVNNSQVGRNVESSLLLATALNPVLGYDKVSQITTRAMQDNTTPRVAALALGFISGKEYDQLVNPMQMTRSSEPYGL